jgi:vancomycin resistance protein VanJ
MPIGRHLTRGPEITWNAAGPVVAAAWLGGWLLKDRYPSLMWFYLIPAVPVVAFTGYWWLSVRSRAPRLARWFTLAVLAIAAGKIVEEDFAWHPRREGGAMRVVHWNVARRFRKAPDVFNVLRGDRPDICMLSEAPRITNLYELGQSALGLPYAASQQGMAIFSRWPFRSPRTVPISYGRAWVVRIATPQGPLDVMAFDLISNPVIDRFPPMDELAAWAGRRRSGIPLLVLGDFNTCRDSLSFRQLRGELRNVYESAGRGWPYSWPVPLPLYAIDLAWASDDLHVVSHRFRTSLLSDHRRQVMDLDLAGGAGRE